MQERLTPHPWKSFTEPLSLADEAAAKKFRRTHINCTEPGSVAEMLLRLASL
jgi:hypothetical protein